MFQHHMHSLASPTSSIRRYQKEMAKQMKKYETHDESVETCMLGLQEMDTGKSL